MEKAIQRRSASSYLADTEHLHGDWTLVREYPLSRELLALSHVWQSPDGGEYVIAAKGAPEAIADLCHFDDRAAADAGRAGRGDWPTQGLRVLGVARARLRRADVCPASSTISTSSSSAWSGWPTRCGRRCPPAIKECYARRASAW